MPVNYAVLERVKKAIRRHPEQLVMNKWHCGTSHCIAGWIQVLERPDIPPLGIQAINDPAPDIAAKCLGISIKPYMVWDDNRLPLGKLFLKSRWPDVFEEMYHYALTSEEKVEVACMVIDDWMLQRWKEEHGE